MTLQLSNFPHDYVWPDDDLSVIPDWVYTDQAIYEREVERIFHGHDLELCRARSGDSERRRFHPLQCRADPDRGDARRGRLDPRLREPLRASRLGILPRAQRLGK